MNCQASKGFLTLSDCGNPATSACTHCGRTLCMAHLSPQSGFSMCYDCAATQQQPAQEATNETDYDDTWAHGYRSSYYSSSGYSPHRSSYDSQDTRSFDERGSDTFDDDERAGGFDAS